MADDPTPAPAPAGEPWFQGVDTETLGYLQNRGLDKVDAKAAALKAIEFHRNAEKLVGVPSDQVLRLPKDATDSAGWDAVRKRLGRPDTADGYDLAAIKDKAGDEFVGFFKQAAFKAGLSKEDATALAAAYVGFAEKTEATETEQAAVKLSLEQQSLKKDWGSEFEVRKNIASSAAQKLGVTPEALGALESQIGYKAVFEMFHRIGTAMGEDSFVRGGPGGPLLGPAQARDKIAALKRDTGWIAKYLAGDIAANQEMTQLHAIAHGGQ